jgi:hypothetical protein
MAAASRRFLGGYWYGQPRGRRPRSRALHKRQENADIVTRMMPHIAHIVN